MDTQITKRIKAGGWQSFAMVLSTVLGILTMPEIRALVSDYPKALLILATATLIITSITKIITNYLKLQEELNKFN